jgi:hypothetical protein
MPYGERHGVPVHELRRTGSDGEPRTLVQHMLAGESRSIPIPVRMSETGAPGARSCTFDYKIAPIAKWLKEHGATEDSPADVMIGISWDELHRMSTKRAQKHERPVFPLLDLRMHREACKRVIEGAGLPVPPKSSCYFCPFHRPSVWATMRRAEPVLFYRAADIEDTLNARRDAAGKDRVYLTRFGKPLRDVIIEEQPGLDFGTGPGETCDEGYCWT